MFPFCHNSCWLLGKSFANCENLTDYCFKYLKGKAFGRGKTKRILNKEFDIGKSIVIQGASLKAKVAEHTIDTAIDKRDNKKNVKR